MELHAFDAHLVRKAGMAHTHDLAVVGPGGHRQFLGTTRALDRQRVVAVDREGFGQPREHALTGGRDLAGLAVHEVLRPNDLAPKRRADRLVAQAHAEDRQPAGACLDRRHRNARFGRRARPRRYHQPRNAGRDALADLGHADLVVAEHLHLRSQLAEVLHQVVGEGIVVVDHQEFHFLMLLECGLPNAEVAKVSQKTQKEDKRFFIACSPPCGFP